MHKPLPWPLEIADGGDFLHDAFSWAHSRSNIALDFHGDPVRAGLVVFSDGNHHMALRETLAAFKQDNPALSEIFYATTPPNVLVQCMQSGRLQLGNLTLSRQPDVFIGPKPVLDKLAGMGKVNEHMPFMRSLGNVLLVRKGNPNAITSIADILNGTHRLFMSNPETEKASFDVYSQTLLGLAQQQCLDSVRLNRMLNGEESGIVFGERIHHRELPQAIYDDVADVALVYYHLALRYVRIFPEFFEMIPLGGSIDEPAPNPANICTTYHAAEVNGAGHWASAVMDYLFNEKVTAIYRSHGLTRP